jgi:hypothetical protein
MTVVLSRQSALLLERWQTVELVDARGATARVERGCVWVTMNGAVRDIVVGPGQSFTVDRNGRTLLHAEAPTALLIEDPAPAPSLGAIVARLLARLGRWAAREVESGARLVPHYY